MAIDAHWLALLLIVTLLQAQEGLTEKVIKHVVELKQVDEQLTTTTTCKADGQCDTITVDECGIWLALSTIPGSGLGMFAGRDFDESEEMMQSGDIVIPIVDYAFNQRGAKKDFLWDEYVWQAETVLTEHEGLVEVNAASPGFGSAANSFLDLLNVDEWKPEVGTGLDRQEDPGAGAFSAYHDRKSTARGHIKAGQELFVSYGNEWFTGRDFLGPIPITGDHDIGQELISKFKEMKQEAKNDAMSRLLDEMWDTFVMKSPYMDTSRVLNALPSSREDMEIAMSQGLLEMRKQKHQVTLQWLQEHGTCMDNIRIAPSTIRQAGRGAFATRFLPKNSVVAPLPMISVPNKKSFAMYSIVRNDNGRLVLEKDKGPVAIQLLVNYCMGHAESSMLLCPYGLMTAAVNHNQTLANVRLEWGDPTKTGHHPDWLNMTVQELARKYSAGVVMTLVATRDIQPGEEIFMDYGDEWETAWNEHVQKWKPAKNYVDAPNANEPNAELLNADKESILRTVFEQIEDPYHNVKLMCEVAFKHGRRWRRKMQEHGTAQSFLKEADEGRGMCDVLHWEKDEDGTILYTALLFGEDDDGYEFVDGKLDKVPRDAFVFVDSPYKSDMHLPNAFRHEIMIPDEIFPEKWKNAGKESSEAAEDS